MLQVLLEGVVKLFGSHLAAGADDGNGTAICTGSSAALHLYFEVSQARTARAEGYGL